MFPHLFFYIKQTFIFVRLVRAKAMCNNILINKSNNMIYSQEVQHMCVVKKGPNHGPALGRPPSEKALWVRPYTICKNNSRMAVLMASHTKSVFNASNNVFPGRISEAIAAE